MKILFLPKYTALGASSRMRTYQYLPYYRAAGIDCTVKPLFDDAYLNNLYAGKRNILNVLSSYCKRIGVCFTFYRYDKIYVEKEFFPYLPAFTVWLMVIFKKKYVVDYDDAIFHNYDQSSNFFVKMFLGQKIDQVMKNAEVVIAGNSYLAKRAMKAGAKKVVIIPTVIDLERYPKPEFNKEEEKDSFAENRRIIVGWIGTETTFQKHLLLIKDWLIKAQQSHHIELRIVGVLSSEVFMGDHVKFLPWTADSEVATISEFDIGIMPLKNSCWEEGKCAYKLVQYLACGKPVIASYVGMNSQLCIDGETGYLADTEETFLNSLHLLIQDELLRKKMGDKGRAIIEEKYNLHVTSKEWIKLMLA